jgi:hypothetical protein
MDTSRTHTANARRPLLRRVFGLMALASVAATLVAAAPAGAQQKPFTDENGNQHCMVKLAANVTSWVPHGTTLTLTYPNGSTATWKCDDGRWEKQAVIADSRWLIEIPSEFADAGTLDEDGGLLTYSPIAFASTR